VRVVLLLAAMLAATLSACEKSPDKSARSGQAAFLSPSLESHGQKPSEKLPVPVSSAEEPAWLTDALNDPDPKVRIQALETWAQHPGEKLDPVTHALVDPDESVRARAQELFEEAMARR